jgi:WD40 repeat protein
MEVGAGRMPFRWDAEMLALPDHTTLVSSLAWNFDGTQLAASYADSMLAVRPYRFRDGFDNLTLEDKTHISTWDMQPVPVENVLRLDNREVDRVEWTLDGQNIITETTEIRADNARFKRTVIAQVRRWDSETGSLQQTLLDIERDTNFFQALAFAWSIDYQHLAYNDGTNTVFIDGQPFVSVDYGTVLELLWSPDGKLLGVVHGSSDYYYISTFVVRTGERIMFAVGPDYYVNSWAWSPDASMLAVVSPWLNASGTSFSIRVYETLHMREYMEPPNFYSPLFEHYDRFQFPPETDAIPTVVAWSASSDLLAIGNLDSIALYDFGDLRSIHREKPIVSLPAFEVTALDWSPDGTMIAAGSNDGTVRLYGVLTPGN